MARNLAQLVFLAYCVYLIFRSRRFYKTLLLYRVSEGEFAAKTKGIVNKFGFLRLKKSLSPLLFWLNAAALCAFALDLVLQLLLGWFDFFAVPMKILNSLAVLLCGCEAYLCAVMDSIIRFDKPFVLYNWDPDGERIFSSGVLDILLCLVGPIAIVVSNFLAL